MQISSYFQQAIDNYRAELHDLAGDGSNRYFESNIASKRSSLDALMPMSADFPEMVAPVFHKAIKFSDVTNIKRLVAQEGADDFPAWELLRTGVIFADEALVNEVLQYKHGKFLLTFSVGVEFLLHQKTTSIKKKVAENNGSPDVDGDWNDGEAPNLTGLDNIDSSE